MEIIKDLILQLAFIFVPLILYHSLWLSNQIQNKVKPNRLLFMSLTLLSSILCLTYPIHIETLLPVTLVTIPLMVSFFYGGYGSGFIVLICAFFYSFVMNDFSWTHSFYILSFSTIFLFLTSRWEKMKKRFKYFIGFFIGCISVILFYTFETFSHSEPSHSVTGTELFLSLAFITFSSLGTISVIEYIIENVRLRVQLIQSEKMSVISELAASVAHEVRNPLTVIRGFIQLMNNQQDTKQQEYTKLILSELDRAQEIITDYLNLAKREYVKMEKVDLSKVIHEVCTLMMSYAHLKSIKIETSIAPTLFVNGDEYKLKQVLINLMKNAIEAIDREDGKVTVHAYELDKQIHIEIMDNGVGMSSEQLKRLGEPFYSLKEKRTGLGLMVTQSIMKLHHGKIEFQSTLNKGTTVSVSIPKWIDKN